MRLNWFVLLTLTAFCVGIVGTASAQSWGDRFEQLMGDVTGDKATQSSEPASTQTQTQTETQTRTQAQTQLPEPKVAAGLRAALADGAARAVTQLGQKGGFWSDPARRIPLPSWVDNASFLLRAAGYSEQLDQLHLTMNRAAEEAVSQVGPIVRDTINGMSVADAYAILSGGNHAATQYLREHAGAALADRIEPIVADATAQSTAAGRYQTLVSQAKPLLSLAPNDLNLDLNSYVTHKALDGLFAVIAEQEAQIRANPVARGSDLLRAVFGSG